MNLLICDILQTCNKLEVIIDRARALCEPYKGCPGCVLPEPVGTLDRQAIGIIHLLRWIS